MRTDAPVRQIDVSKTLLALAGLDEDDDFAGRDLRWSLETDPIENPRFGLASHQFTATLQSGPWLFVLELGRHFERPLERMRYTGEAELFNLADDPLCENDLLLEEFDQSSRMRERLIEWLNAAEDLGMREDQQRSAEDESMLASLGYGGGEDDDSTSALWNPEKWESKAQWEQDPWRRLFEDETFTVDDFRNAEKR